MSDKELKDLLVWLGSMIWIKKEFWDCNDPVMQSFNREYDRLNELYKTEMETRCVS